MKFIAALKFLARKSVMPTALRSWALQELPVELRERSFFSAGVVHAEFLQEGLDAVEAIVYGTADRATMRLQLRNMLDGMGYVPDPLERGSLTDLRSDRRLNLILDTNAAQARAYGRHKLGQAPEILKAYPCSELVRVGGLPMAPRDWPAKWVAAGGVIREGRMIARKDDPIWSKPISAGGFNRFGTRYGPFDFESGMRTKDVSFEEAKRLGVFAERSMAIAPDEEGFNEHLSSSATRIKDKALLDALLKDGLIKQNADGRLVLG